MTESLRMEKRVPSRARLWAEFGALFLAAPLVMAFLLPPSAPFPALFGVTALGLVLLHVTEGFRWSGLVRGLDRIGWRAVGLFALLTAAVAGTVVALHAPEQALILPREQPALFVAVMLLYPPLSALPQEIVFRPLFFRRYGPLLPGLWPAIVLNAALFSLAHLMFWSWIVAAMTFCGGIAFAWACESRRNFPMAVVLHSVAGWIVFAAGPGMFFYSGNIERPF
ncbi:CPBP family intramembrane glutamic endopeptidase [Rhodovulum sp.]|uniref:CPBP family intramembrane glutamic endopeptidase n=1 Tax=Rhodovulum sp. TaxID=34009 RepID=UPI002581031E|nr:CPBP family intramembrane glutamic endopeptidase [Rhodovulum sp.]